MLGDRKGGDSISVRKEQVLDPEAQRNRVGQFTFATYKGRAGGEGRCGWGKNGR